MKRIIYAASSLLPAALLSACVWFEDGLKPALLSAGNTAGGVVATGAPLAGVPFTVARLAEPASVLYSGTVRDDAYFEAPLAPEGAPYLITVTDTTVTPNVALKSILLRSDFGVEGKANVNVTPISNMVATIVRNEMAAGGEAAADVSALRAGAAEAVKTVLKPLLDAAGAGSLSAGDLLTRVFVPTQDPIDKVLDAVQVACTGTACTITPASASAAAKTGAISLDVSSRASATTAAASVKTALDANAADMLKTAPVVVVFSAASSWGTAADSWAGYSGKLAIYNFSDVAISGGAKLYFESDKLKTQGFWDASAQVQGNKHLLSLPAWANVAPVKAGGRPQTFTFGFNGQGAYAAVNDLRACNIDGRKCLILVDDGKVPLDLAQQGAKIRSWSNFLATLPPSSPKPETASVPAPNENPEKVGSASVSVQEQQAAAAGTGVARVALSSTASWAGGFNGELEIANNSTVDWTSWKVSFTLPSGVKGVGGWGNYKLQTAGSTVSFQNEAWNGNLAKGKSLKLGFGGSGELAGSLSGCTISVNGAASVACDAASIGAKPSAATTTSSTSAVAAEVKPPAAQAQDAGSKAVGVADGGAAAAPVQEGAEPKTVTSSVKSVQNKRAYVGYYPSWSDNWFSAKDWAGKDLGDDQILVASKLARIPATYTHVVVAFAQPNFSYSTAANFNANAWTGTGLNFNAGPKDIAASLRVLKARGMKVLLAVGGATYNEWAALSAENGSADGTITKALAQVMLDVGFDGLDVDYEVEGTKTAEYKGAVNAMRKAVDLANGTDGGQRILALAGWSTGADCTLATGTTACGGVASYWGGKAGGERLVFADPAMAAKIDMVNIMSYDARFEDYDGVKAWQLYRDLFPSTTIVNIGLETAPEGWAGGMLVVEDAHAQCTGSTILKDQLGAVVNKPYSVHRYASAPLTNRTNSNPRDGAMLWQILKTATASCGAATVASPGTIAAKISSLYQLPSDPRSAWK